MEKPILHDYLGKPIPWEKADQYYRDFNMSPESMQIYELYKQSIIRENEDIEKKSKSIRNKLFEDRDKFLTKLNEKKWNNSNPTPSID